MKRILTVVVLILAACGGDEVASELDSTTTVPPNTTVASGTIRFSDPSVPVVLEIPELWREGKAPIGIAAAFYAPSDDNAVSERLTVGVVDDEGEFTLAAVAVLVSNGIAERQGPNAVLSTSTTTIGTDDRPAEVIRYNFRLGSERSIATTWLAEAAGQIVAITFYADPENPVLYTDLVDQVLATAEFEN
jgi:hypothetical protein